MRERELRRLFLGLAAAAAPGDFMIAGCGGVVTDRSSAAEETGGAPFFAGKTNPSPSGGAPGFLGFAAPTGGAPMYMGGGQMGYVPTGGAPVVVGAGGFLGRVAGGAPNFNGATGGSSTGGAYVENGGSSTGGAYVNVDSGLGPVYDAGIPPACTNEAGVFCRSFCIQVDGATLGDAQDCRAACGIPTTGLGSCERISWNGALYLRCTPECTGRRPPGLVDAAPIADGHVRAYFEEMSRLEAASVPAFRVLARELRAHGAPPSLLRAARRAARDEVRHTRMGTLLAERFGGHYLRPSVVAKPLRSVEEIATDNAVEGCVRETFGAMIATWQSRAASDPVVRRIMRRVAVDETRHAALALRVAAWADRRLDTVARLRVREAQRRAVEQVMQELTYQASPALVAIAGVPTSGRARGLARALTERLWS